MKVWDEGEGKASVPVWLVETSSEIALRIREGNSVAPAGIRERKGEIRSIDRRSAGGFSLEVEIKGQKTARSSKHDDLLSANDPALKGQTVTLLPAVFDFSRQKLKKLWQQRQPGAWLVKAKLAARSAKLPAEVSEDLRAADQLAKANDD